MSITEETNPLKKGINRRDLIKKGAVAGAVFWSVPIIESITSAAAAASGAPTTGSISCSWAYVVYQISGDSTIYVAGYSGGASTLQNNCMSYAATSGLPATEPFLTATSTTTSPVGSTTFTLPQTHPGGADIVTYTGTLGTGTGTQPPDCTALTQSGNYIQAASNVTILAWFEFGAHNGTGYSTTNPTAGTKISLPYPC